MDILDSIPLKQKARLHRVADLLLVIYKTLVEMRYLEPSQVEVGPHDVSELMPLYESLGLAPAVIYLYSILPYVCPRDREHFFQGGEFADFRDKEQVKQGRDPLHDGPEGDDYNADNGPYMRPWYTALSDCGDCNSVIIYDTRTDKICIVGQSGNFCDDPNIEARNGEVASDDEDEDGDDEGIDADDDGAGVENANNDGSDGQGEDDEEEEGYYDDHDADSGVSDLEEDADDEDYEIDTGVVEEDGTIAQIDARSAATVLRDINRWYRQHETPILGPGGYGAWVDTDTDEFYDPPLAALYKEHGWPDDFDGDAFEVALERRHVSAGIKYDAAWPPKSEAISAKYELERHDQDLERYRARIASAKTPGEEWEARWELFCGERRREASARRLRESEALREREFPGGQWRRTADLPLLEYEKIRGDDGYRLLSTKWRKKEEEKEKGAQKQPDGDGEGEPPRKKIRRGDLNSLPPKTRRTALLQRATEASRADAVRLCGADRVAELDDPARPREKPKKEKVPAEQETPESSEKDLERLRRWAAGIPAGEETAATREKAEAAIVRLEKERDDCRDRVARTEKGLAEDSGTAAVALT